MGLAIIFMWVLSSHAQEMPALRIFATTKQYCINKPINFASLVLDNTPVTPETTYPVVYEWSIFPEKGLVSLPSLNSSTISLTFSAAATVTLSLRIKIGEFSTNTSTVITVASIPKASFNATFSDVGYPNQLILTSYSTNSVVNHWIFSDTNIIDSTANTVKSYTSSGSYSVMLVTVGGQGCRDTARYNFYLVDSSGITLPNVFSPNADGVNDVYKPIARGIQLMSAKIYNRNAVLINYWDSPEGFWDGYTNSGEHCTEGVYFIILNATGFDGKTYSLSGYINLVR